MKKILIVLSVLLPLVLVGCSETKLEISQDNEPKTNIEEMELDEPQTIIEEETVASEPTGKKVVYEDLIDNFNPKYPFFVENVIDNGDSFTLQGLGFEPYAISEEELQLMVDVGEIVLDGSIYKIVKPSGKSYNGENVVYDLYDGNREYADFSIKTDENQNYFLERNAQIFYCYKSTGRHLQIEVSKDCEISNANNDDKWLAEKEFDNFIPKELRDSDTHPLPSYTFTISDGIVTSMVADHGV